MLNSEKSIFLLCVRLVSLFFAGALLAENVPVVLDIAAAGQPVQLAVPEKGPILLTLIRSTKTALNGPVTLKTTVFRDDNGISVPVQLVQVTEDGQTRPLLAPIKLPESRYVTIGLVVPRLPSTANYSGSLFAICEGQDAVIWKLTLSRAVKRSAVLALDRSTAAIVVTRSFWMFLPGTSSEVSVGLHEKNDSASIQGITARVEQTTKGPSGDLDLHSLKFVFNGKPVQDIQVAPGPTDDRSIAEGDRSSVVKISVGDLKAGDYSGVLHFSGSNSLTDDAQKLSLGIQVRDSPYKAILVLALAILVSFVATKVLGSMRDRLSFRKRIRDLQPQWLLSEPPSLPIIWLNATLRQAADLSSRTWLTGGSLIEDRLSRASAALSVIDKIRRLRENLKNAGMPHFVEARALAALRRVIVAMGNAPDRASTPQIEAALTQLNNWLDASQRETCYWADLQPAIAALLSDVGPGLAGNTVTSRLIESLKGAINTDPANLDLKIQAEQEYAALKILWDRRAAPEFKTLVDAYESTNNIDDLFRVADQRAWERVMQAEAAKQLSIENPLQNGPDPPQAFDPLLFSVKTGDIALDSTYLVQWGMVFSWDLNLVGRRKGKRLQLRPVSTEPRVVQYVPFSGTLIASVNIKRGTEVVTIEGVPLRINGSTDFGYLRGLEEVEVISIVISAALAIVTGIATFYYKSTTFGSIQDYLSLFAWGTGVDQTKTFLQNLQAYSGSAQGVSASSISHV
jgi:hypothetical protein